MKIDQRVLESVKPSYVVPVDTDTDVAAVYTHNSYGIQELHKP